MGHLEVRMGAEAVESFNIPNSVADGLSRFLVEAAVRGTPAPFFVFARSPQIGPRRTLSIPFTALIDVRQSEHETLESGTPAKADAVLEQLRKNCSVSFDSTWNLD